MGVRIEKKPLIFRNENRVSFDTMIFIDLILTEDIKLKLLSDWKNNAKNTKFFISEKVIKETTGVLINKNFSPYYGDPTAVKEAINKIIKELSIKKLNYDKKIDNKSGYQLFCEYEERYPEECHIQDARIVAHLRREQINVVYSIEKRFRRLAQIAEIEARKSIMDKFDQISQ